MIDRARLLQEIRDNQTRLIQQARLKQLGTLIVELTDIGDDVDRLDVNDSEFDGKLDAIADQMEELNNRLFGDEKWETQL
jgi:hypothetical protein